MKLSSHWSLATQCIKKYSKHSKQTQHSQSEFFITPHQHSHGPFQKKGPYD